MAKRQATTQRRGNARDEQSDEQRPRPPFLKSHDIGSGASLKLIPGTVRTVRGNYGDQLIVDVQIKGSTYSWGIGVTTPNLRLLVEAVVNAPGKPVQVKPMVSQQGRPYIAIVSAKSGNEDEIPF